MKVSVYIPTKNRAQAMSAAVSSVLAQTYHDIEVIVVDDGSEDDTPSALRSLRESDGRLRVIRNEQSVGAPAARNLAIKAARGQFVTGLDDDDLFEPYRIEAFICFWTLLDRVREPASCLYAQDKWRSNGDIISVTSRQGYTTAQEMPARNQVGNQVFAPREHFISAGLFDTSLPAWQDFELFLRMIKAFGPARLVDVPSYIFDVSPRPDRISAHEHKVRSAYNLICEKHFSDAPHDRQRLALQMFSEYYGIRPGVKDFIRFSSDGRWLSGHVAMLRAALHRPKRPALVSSAARSRSAAREG